MKILLTNDDGIHADGLWALHKRFVKKHEVTVIAPDRERSAVGYAITLAEPIRLTRVTVNGERNAFAVSGTPVDCIKLGLFEILDSKPDMVVSGINPGANVGMDINYSGTVSAAREAALYGIPAIAVSTQGDQIDGYDDMALFIETLAVSVFEKGLPFGTILNVNIPGIPLKDTAGVKISRQGNTLLSERFDKRKDPRNRSYYWLGCEMDTVYDHSDVDGSVLNRNYISITPIKCDLTDYQTVDDLKAWNISKDLVEKE